MKGLQEMPLQLNLLIRIGIHHVISLSIPVKKFHCLSFEFSMVQFFFGSKFPLQKKTCSKLFQLDMDHTAHFPSAHMIFRRQDFVEGFLNLEDHPGFDFGGRDHDLSLKR